MMLRAALCRRVPALARGFRASRPAADGPPLAGITTPWGVKFNWSNFVMTSDQSSHGLRLYHKLNFALIGLGPLALMLSPSSYSVPVDLLLGFIIPLHGHIGGNDLISDYAKKITKAKSFDLALRRTLLGVTVVSFFGLTKLNIDGPGVTEAFKSVWRPRSSSH
jgi:hypothetical protein